MRNKLNIIIRISTLSLLLNVGCSNKNAKTGNIGHDSTKNVISKMELFQADSIISPQSEPDWSGLVVVWREYLRRPTEANSDALIRYLPKGSFFRRDSAFHSTFYIIYNDLQVLEKLVQNKNRTAVRIAFKLFNISDGDFSEYLDQMLGSLITIDPQLFLEELQFNWGNISRLDALVSNLGEAYIDKNDSSRTEIKRRIDALSTVTVSQLSSVKVACVQELHRQLKQY